MWGTLIALQKDNITSVGETKTTEYNYSAGPIVHVLAMVAKCCPDILTAAKIRLVVHLAFSGVAVLKRDYALMKAAAQCLQATQGYLQTPQQKQQEEVETKTNASSEAREIRSALLEAAPGIRDVILGFWCGNEEAETRQWFEVCEEALHALFHVHPSPDKVFASIIVPLYADLASNSAASASSEEKKVTTDPSRLSRVLFTIGQGAICSLVFTERIANLAKKYAELNKIASANHDSSGKHLSAEKEREGEVDAMEEEMGMVAAADAEHERIFTIVTERQLVCDNLFGKFHPLVAYVVANESNTFSHGLLRETSLLALCRLMSVSSVLCELYLPLLFTIVERETSEHVRTTVMIALGDLAFRFPNSLEPWTARMYARLSDSDVLVRYNTLMTLTHLILNDMIKVKGQVSHVVMCLNDSNQKVRDLAGLFFTELSKRSNNPVYNLLGDIIGSLSLHRYSISHIPNARNSLLIHTNACTGLTVHLTVSLHATGS